MKTESENQVVRSVIKGLDSPSWKLSGEKNGVKVFSTRSHSSPYIGYKTISEHETDIETMTFFLGDNITTAMLMMNHRYVEGSVAVNAEERIVRTAFKMPPGFSNRDFVHNLYVKRLNSFTSIIAYGPIPSSPENPEIPGFIRCPIFPSGQRVTETGQNRIRVEHLMVYGLAGSISSRVQNIFFHSGHVSAYLKEWNRLKHLVINSEWRFGNDRTAS